MIISCFANDVHLAYIYIRGEMPMAQAIERALQEARAKNFIGKNILGTVTIWKCTCIAARAPTFAARKPASSNRLKASGHIRASRPPYFPAVLALDVPDHRQQRRDALQREAHRRHGARNSPSSARPTTPAPHRQPQRHVKKPGYYEIEIGKATIGN